MSLLLNNNATSRLGAALGSGATSLSVTTGEGGKFPTPAAGDWFPLTIVNAAGALEIVRCTARSSDTLTIVRAQEGTTALAFSSGDRIELRLTVAALQGAIQEGRLTRIGSVAGTASAITGTLLAPFAAYATGEKFDFVAAYDCPAGGVTINLNGAGAIALTKKGNIPLGTADYLAGSVVSIAHDGTRFQLVAGAGGGANNDVFYENSATLSADYTITAGKNAMSAGPITINTGVTVTIPTGSTWSIV